jgi:HSP20 family protein
VALILLDHRERDDNLQRILDWLDQDGVSFGGPAECTPAMDVFESSGAVEIIADLPGLRAEDIHVVFARGLVVVAGQKQPSRCEHRDAAFHLAERSFGRFARVFRMSGAADAGRARATLTAGELHIVIPRIEERRGGEIRIPIATE